MKVFNVKQSDFEAIEPLADSSYDLEYSIERAIQILDDYTNQHELIDCDFTKNVWVLYNNTTKNLVYLKLEEIHQLSIFISNTSLMKTVKCWLSTLIEQNFSSTHIGKLFNCLKQILLMSKAFDENSVDKVKDFMKYEVASPGVTLSHCNASLNFLDYFQAIDPNGYYSELFWELKHQTHDERQIRKLPSSHDVLKFSMIVEDYFNSTLSHEEYLRYFPIFLWWNFTNIIPVRISEFCGIERDCLIENEDNVYIKIPRSKQFLTRKRVTDEILIPKFLSHEIKKYVDKTNSYGDTNTLISYLSIPKLDGEVHKYKKYELDVFKYRDMNYLLEIFYNEVVLGKYELVLFESETLTTKQEDLNLSKTFYRKIRLNDTRHFAFLNLMLQGYHPVEIARLGGHTSIHAQYHYHQHQEYWVDSEVMKLALKFNSTKNTSKKSSSVSSMGEYINDDDKAFMEKFILRPPITDIKIKLELGYCTDPNQLCFVDEHFYCDHWRITFDEYKINKKEIQAKIKEKQTESSTLLDALINLHVLGIKKSKDPSYSENCTLFNKQLSETSKQLRKSLIDLAKIKERVSQFE